MDDPGRKRLRSWLQKSLANHPENDNGLVAYVEAIVGDAEGSVRAPVCPFGLLCLQIILIPELCSRIYSLDTVQVLGVLLLSKVYLFDWVYCLAPPVRVLSVACGGFDVEL